jgi:clan AA aspartic protease
VISGIVSLLHATVSVPFRLPNRPDVAIEFVIDTGFTDFLCLPPEVVSVLGLPFEYNMRVNLADNSNAVVRYRYHSVEFRGARRSCTGYRVKTFAWDSTAGWI